MLALLIEANQKKKDDVAEGKKSMKLADQEEIRNRWDEIVNRGNTWQVRRIGVNLL